MFFHAAHGSVSRMETTLVQRRGCCVTLVTCEGDRAEPRMTAGMTLSALLVSVDEASTQLLQRVLEELGIRVECCADFVRAGIRLAQERFDVVIVDGTYKSATSLLQET